MGVARWLRLDICWDRSEWVIVLEPGAQLAWIKLLCHAKAFGRMGTVKAMSDLAASVTWGIPQENVRTMLEAAQAGEEPALQVVDGNWILVNWKTYQEPDEGAVDRMRKHRGRVTEGDAPLRRNAPNNRNGGRNPSRDRDKDKDKDKDKTPLPAAAPRANSTAAAKEAIDMLGNGGAEALEELRPPGGMRAALASIRTSLLYETENEGIPDESVKGLSRVERRQLVARALVEMRANGSAWSSAALAGFIRRLRSPPTRAGPNGKRDPWAMDPEPQPQAS